MIYPRCCYFYFNGMLLDAAEVALQTLPCVSEIHFPINLQIVLKKKKKIT